MPTSDQAGQGNQGFMSAASESQGSTPSENIMTNMDLPRDVAQICKSFTEKLERKEMDRLEKAFDIPYFVSSGIDKHPSVAQTVCPDAGSWLAIIEARCPRSEWTDEGLINVVVKYALDSAAAAAQLCKTQNPRNWIAFKETFLKYFPKSSSLDVTLTELETTKIREGENLENYNVRLQVLVAKAMSIDPTKEPLVRYLAGRRFVKIFPPPFAQRLSDSQYVRHGELLAQGLEYMKQHPEAKLVYEEQVNNKKVRVNALPQRTTESHGTEYNNQSKMNMAPTHRGLMQHQSGPQPSTSSFREFSHKRKLPFCTFCKKTGHDIDTCYRFRGQAPGPSRQHANNSDCNCGSTSSAKKAYHSHSNWKSARSYNNTHKRPIWNPRRKSNKSENQSGNGNRPAKNQVT